MAVNITNKYGISEAFVRACTIDRHVTMGDISVTQLIDSPQVRMLKRHNDTESDVTDRIYMLMGTAIHKVLELGEIDSSEARMILEAAEVLMRQGEEKAANWMYKFVEEKYPDSKNADRLLEKTLSFTIEGMTISGTADMFTISLGLLDDYKNTSVWAYMNPESVKKWTAQLNVYAFLFREHGYDVNKAQITAIFRDFSPAKSFTKGYPRKPIETFDIKLQPHSVMMEYLTKRVRLHKAAELDGVIPDCTPKEMWGTKDTFAVTTPGRKRAIKVLPSNALAEAYIQGEGSKYEGIYIHKRPGEAKRCDSYCEVAEFCPQNKKRLERLHQEQD